MALRFGNLDYMPYYALHSESRQAALYTFSG